MVGHVEVEDSMEEPVDMVVDLFRLPLEMAVITVLTGELNYL